MEQHDRCPCILHDFVGPTDPEDMHREPGPSSVWESAEVLPDDTAVPVRGRRIQEDVPVVKKSATLEDPTGRVLGGTTYRRWEETME